MRRSAAADGAVGGDKIHVRVLRLVGAGLGVQIQPRAIHLGAGRGGEIGMRLGDLGGGLLRIVDLLRQLAQQAAQRLAGALGDALAFGAGKLTELSPGMASSTSTTGAFWRGSSLPCFTSCSANASASSRCALVSRLLSACSRSLSWLA